MRVLFWGSLRCNRLTPHRFKLTLGGNICSKAVIDTYISHNFFRIHGSPSSSDGRGEACGGLSGGQAGGICDRGGIVALARPVSAPICAARDALVRRCVWRSHFAELNLHAAAPVLEWGAEGGSLVAKYPCDGRGHEGRLLPLDDHEAARREGAGRRRHRRHGERRRRVATRCATADAHVPADGGSRPHLSRHESPLVHLASPHLRRWREPEPARTPGPGPPVQPAALHLPTALTSARLAPLRSQLSRSSSSPSSSSRRCSPAQSSGDSSRGAGGAPSCRCSSRC